MTTTTFTDAPRVAVLGTGTIGAALAFRLLGAGVTLDVWNRSSGPAMALVEHGATAYADPEDAVAAADVVLTVLPTADAVRSVMFDGCVVDALRPGAVWAQLGSIGPPAVDELAMTMAFRRPDVGFVDVAASGGRRAAECGQLLILAAGKSEAVARLEPVFAEVGRYTVQVGPVGAASRLGLVVSTWLGFVIEGAAEAAALADRLEVPPASFAEAVVEGFPASSLALATFAWARHGDITPDLTLSWALGGLRAAVDAGGERTVPVAGAIADRWADLASLGWGPLDVGAAGLGHPSALCERPDGDAHRDRASTFPAME